MTRLQNKKKKRPSQHLETVTYAFGIGVGALVGFLFGGVTWLCIGSLLGLGFGFLMDAHKNQLFKS